jgi:hypothetical protein
MYLLASFKKKKNYLIKNFLSQKLIKFVESKYFGLFLLKKNYLI